MSDMCKIIVPATSANMGPCFDCAGIALDRYLTLTVQNNHSWEFKHEGAYLPPPIYYEDHLMYRVAHTIAKRKGKKMNPSMVTINSDIPLARGLGSSASAILAGIELANQTSHLSLTEDEKLTLATELEGHPDNVAPALLGGLVLSTPLKDSTVVYERIRSLDLQMVIAIPETKLRTDEARGALPTSYTRENAAHASSISNVMVAALLQENYELAGKLMEEDLFQEPYRSQLIPNYDFIRTTAKELGAYGTVISGAGPTMISFSNKQHQQRIADELQKLLPNYEVAMHSIDVQGVRVHFE